MSGMRCISLWQPTASALTVRRPGSTRFLKGVETRGWAPAEEMIGQRLAIASSKSPKPRDPDGNVVDLREDWMRRVKRQSGFAACFAAAGFNDFVDLPFGMVLCHGILTRVVPTEKLVYEVDSIEQYWGDYGPGRYGWVLEDVQVLPAPVPVMGRQGIYWWEEKAA